MINCIIIVSFIQGLSIKTFKMVTAQQIKDLHKNLADIHNKSVDSELINSLFGEDGKSFLFYEKLLFVKDEETFVKMAMEKDDFFNQYVRQLRIMWSYLTKKVSFPTKIYLYRVRESAFEGAMEYSKIISSSMYI